MRLLPNPRADPVVTAYDIPRLHNQYYRVLIFCARSSKYHNNYCLLVLDLFILNNRL